MKSNIFILIITCLALCIILFSCKEKEPSDFTIDWTCVTESAPWAPRFGHTSVVMNNKIWIIGGYGNGVRGDVWYSSDGMNWVCATESAAWSPRCEHTSIVFDNKIWVIGGGTDVWYSTDGVNWICANESATWFPRFRHLSRF